MEQKKILIVDDSMAVSGTLGDVLEAEGYSVTRCGDGASALVLARREYFDVVIADHRMPGMSGIAVVQQLRTRWPRSFIIGISAGHKEKDFIDAGADAYLNKPFTVQELLATIRECTGEQQE